jgi:hypothetical protein
VLNCFTFKTLRYATFLAIACFAGNGSEARADSFTVTYLGSGVQTPQGITSYYETFNSVSVVNGSFTTNFNGSPITGTYSGAFEILPADVYGGAGGTGSYLAQEFMQSTTLTLSQDVNYFGLWFSALDNGNQLQFYDGSTLVYSFTPQDFSAGVGACPSSSGYCGNPNDGDANSKQQYAYINFYDTVGSFNKVVFTEGPGGNFESDNSAIAMVDSGPVGTVVVDDLTPEPPSLILMGTGLVCLSLFSRKRFRGARASNLAGA